MIVISLTSAWSIKTLNKVKAGLAMGPLRKFVLLNVMNAPLYWYFYTDCQHQYTQVKRHLVKRYLISGDEVLYKRSKREGN